MLPKDLFRKSGDLSQFSRMRVRSLSQKTKKNRKNVSGTMSSLQFSVRSVMAVCTIGMREIYQIAKHSKILIVSNEKLQY